MKGFGQKQDSIAKKEKYKADYRGVYIGYAQGRSGFAELGYFTTMMSNERHWGFSSRYFGTEIKIYKNPVIGFKVGLTGAGTVPMPFGLNLIYYTDFGNGSFVFRPEYGFGFEKGRLTYGYNARIINKKFDLINTHMATLVYYLNLKK